MSGAFQRLEPPAPPAERGESSRSAAQLPAPVPRSRRFAAPAFGSRQVWAQLRAAPRPEGVFPRLLPREPVLVLLVEASLEGLGSRKLFVVPGWQYKLVVAVATKFPSAWRVALEARSPHTKSRL